RERNMANGIWTDEAGHADQTHVVGLHLERTMRAPKLAHVRQLETKALLRTHFDASAKDERQIEVDLGLVALLARIVEHRRLRQAHVDLALGPHQERQLRRQA